jgi:monoamine oxidase
VRRSSDDADIVILGAGASGLAAAAQLSNRDLTIRVLEARNRLGGRVWTWHDAAPCLGVDVGAEFVHGVAQPLADVAHLADVALIDVRASHWERRDGTLTKTTHFEDVLDDVLSKVDKVMRQQRDSSFSHALDAAHVKGDAREIALAFVQGFHAADPSAISARALGGGSDGAGHVHRVLGGFEQVIRALFQRVQDDAIRLGVVARRIKLAKDGVTIECARAHDSKPLVVRATKAIVTVPLSLLAFDGARDGSGDGRLAFAPTLGEKQRAAKKLAMGDVVKVVLRFREPFWTDADIVRARRGAQLEQLGFVHSLREPFPVFWTMYPTIANLVTGWAGGPVCDHLLRLAPGELALHAAGSFARALGVAPVLVERQLMAFWFHDWRADPWSRGAYSYPKAGGIHAARALRAPVADTLFFAGEATCEPPNNGTVHGAIASGLRAAGEVMASYSAR